MRDNNLSESRLHTHLVQALSIAKVNKIDFHQQQQKKV